MSKLSASCLAPSALPDELPVFPLSGVVLLPRARLPLNIFEPRYVAMIEDVMATPGRMLGMIQPTSASASNVTNTAHVPALFRVGCAGRLVSFDETGDGRYMIALQGLCRFAVAEELARDRAYRCVRPDWASFHGDLESPATISIPREAILQTLQSFFRQQNIEADWTALERTTDELLVSSLTMICPFAPNERQALLEASDLRRRAEMLLALMEMGITPQGADNEGGAKH